MPPRSAASALIIVLTGLLTGGNEAYHITHNVSKRRFLLRSFETLPILLLTGRSESRAAPDTISTLPYDSRDRNYNKHAIIRDDIW